MTGLGAVIDAHREIGEAVRNLALARHSGDSSVDAWRIHLVGLLTTHIRWEDDHLLPLYEKRVPAPPRMGKPALIQDEHRKLTALLSGPMALADIVRLKHLLEHHEQREEEAMIPLLEAAASREEIQEALSHYRAWQGRAPEAPASKAPPDSRLWRGQLKKLRGMLDRVEDALETDQRLEAFDRASSACRLMAQLATTTEGDRGDQ